MMATPIYRSIKDELKRLGEQILYTSRLIPEMGDERLEFQVWRNCLRMDYLEWLQEYGATHVKEYTLFDDDNRPLSPPPDVPNPPPMSPNNGAVGLELIRLPKRFPEPPSVFRRFSIAA